MVKLYGKAPFNIVLVHGGPGAKGSLEPLALGINERFSVMEAVQSKYSIHELIEELKEQISENCVSPVTLIGHSWGAWLSVLFSNRYPQLVKKIILIGCPPLTEDYLYLIEERRKLNMSSNELKKYDEINQLLSESNAENKPELLEQLSRIVKQSDNYSPIEEKNYSALDATMYHSIWEEAKQLRKTNSLLKQFKKIKIEMIMIHGDRDPHPYLGVMEPLEKTHQLTKTVILDECGHSPWNEVSAKNPFYQFLYKELNT